jgi:hypothetical protein
MFCEENFTNFFVGQMVAHDAIYYERHMKTLVVDHFFRVCNSFF